MKTNYLIVKLMLIVSAVFILSFSGIVKNGDQSGAVLNAYLKIKDALVKTDAESAGEAAKKLVAVLGDSKDVLLVKIAKSAGEISQTNNVKDQRESFNDLSENVYQLMKGSGDLRIPVYRQYCPMAFNNTGAYWLAAEKEINNPYFGSMMLHCGSVKEEL